MSQTELTQASNPGGASTVPIVLAESREAGERLWISGGTRFQEVWDKEIQETAKMTTPRRRIRFGQGLVQSSPGR